MFWQFQRHGGKSLYQLPPGCKEWNQQFSLAEYRVYMSLSCGDGSARSLEQRTRRSLLSSMNRFHISFSFDWRMPFVCFVFTHDVCDLFPFSIDASNSLIRRAISGPRCNCMTKGSVWDLQHCHCPSHKHYLLVSLVYGNVGEHMPSCIYCEVAM